METVQSPLCPGGLLQWHASTPAVRAPLHAIVMRVPYPRVEHSRVSPL